MEETPAPTVPTAADLEGLGFVPRGPGRPSYSHPRHPRLVVVRYPNLVPPLDVFVGCEPFYGVATRADLETLLRLIGERP